LRRELVSVEKGIQIQETYAKETMHPALAVYEPIRRGGKAPRLAPPRPATTDVVVPLWELRSLLRSGFPLKEAFQTIGHHLDLIQRILQLPRGSVRDMESAEFREILEICLSKLEKDPTCLEGLLSQANPMEIIEPIKLVMLSSADFLKGFYIGSFKNEDYFWATLSSPRKFEGATLYVRKIGREKIKMTILQEVMCEGSSLKGFYDALRRQRRAQNWPNLQRASVLTEEEWGEFLARVPS
jgi:hypothetical protein